MSSARRRFINPDTMARPTGYTHVVETTGKRTIYISGQVAVDPQGNLVGVGDMRAQAEQVFQNLQAALAAVNASFTDVVKLTYFLVDVAQIQAVRDVRDRYIDPAHLPASTAVEVRQLVHPEFLLEIEAVAVLDE
ncbi:MAG: RidA family protein [Anaerolineae bacterium]|nr:RidA family protein [Anaerolineae bacterium]